MQIIYNYLAYCVWLLPLMGVKKLLVAGREDKGFKVERQLSCGRALVGLRDSGAVDRGM